jgi:surface antigen
VRRVVGVLCLIMVVASGAAPDAAASPVASMHMLPSSGVAGVSGLCVRDPGYRCTTGGYRAQSTGWWGTKYGAGWAAINSYGYHNCTLYAAYRVAQNGVEDPGWNGNASTWGSQAFDHGVRVDQSPGVGSIAQWNGGFYGHVAYVESIGPEYIEVTDDNYIDANTGWTDRWRVARTSPAWPDNFIHFNDVSSGGSSPPRTGGQGADLRVTTSTRAAPVMPAARAAEPTTSSARRPAPSTPSTSVTSAPPTSTSFQSATSSTGARTFTSPKASSTSTTVAAAYQLIEVGNAHATELELTSALAALIALTLRWASRRQEDDVWPPRTG